MKSIITQKKVVISIVFLILLVSSINAETEQKVAQFSVLNSAPNSPYAWTPITTHSKMQSFSFTESTDDNNDNISTYICITNDADVDNCSVVNTNTFTPGYTFVGTETNWDYAWGITSRTYYIKLTPNDGIDNGTVNDTIYFNLTDAIPTINGQTSDALNDGDKDIGELITFSMTSHSDTDTSDNHSLKICKTNSINTSGECPGDEWCDLTYTDNAALTCSLTLSTSESNQTYSAYFFVCDCPPYDNSCPGQCSSGYLHTFYVNHAPNITNADILPNSPETTDTLNCSHTFYDADDDTESSTYVWYNSTMQTAYTGITLASSVTHAGETWLCEITPIDEHGFAGTKVNSSPENIQNTPPNQPTNFEVQDGASSYDSNPRNTHDITPHLRWTTSDDDGNSVTTYVCIASSAANRDTENCDIFSSSESDADVDNATGLSYSETSVMYYIRLTPNDGNLNGTALDTNITITNSIPNLPSSLSPTTTHNQTPTLSWTATDPDDGSNDHWPTDTLTFHIKVGTSYGDSTYENNMNANNTGETINNPIPWGIPGNKWGNNTVYVMIWSEDNNGGNSTTYNTTLTLYDYLPQITNIEMTDTGVYSSCTSASCALNPVEHSNTTIAIKVTANDTDNDCDTNSKAHLILCKVNEPDACNESTNNHYNWEIDNIERNGNLCTYTFSSNKTASDKTPEFFIVPDTDYRLMVNVSSQSGRSTDETMLTANWTYGILKAIHYPTTITMGDGTVTLNEWNPGTSAAAMINWGNDVLDLSWNISNPTGSEDIWNLTGLDLMIDDDNSTSTENGAISPIYLNATIKSFQPSGGLKRCISWDCNNNINETLNTYYHIYPPLGLKAGQYNSSLTITIN